MTKLSLLLNIVVLIPVCAGIFTNANWTLVSYGNNTPARSILLSVYLAILVVSIILLLKPDPKMITALLCVQIIYKFITPFTVGSISNPVVISNIFIAIFHCFTVFFIWKDGMLLK
ncbi:hypothetical protein [Thermoflexibacter ruber]|uniref:DoxX-like family protein n=1 Tax=Thermoflexibacter ruber TaxID=1003 RepID=A0A1I2K3M7_9BACT|nr:hypothetical protein [Thermoflexibacter ruber]SFF59661.1 hypothetical protein SAMN04488541_10747 [Thermoflexibacter ruber]